MLSPKLGCSGIFSKFCQGHIEQLCVNLSIQSAMMLWMLVLAGVRDQVGDQDGKFFFFLNHGSLCCPCRWPRSLTSLAMEFGAR